MADLVTIEGELWYVRVYEPETDPWDNTKWNLTIYPDKDSMNTVMDLQAQGVRNKIRKDARGYNISYSRPQKVGQQILLPPKATLPDGTPLGDQMVGNGSKGKVTLEIREFTRQGMKSVAARLDSIQFTDFIPYEKGATKGF